MTSARAILVPVRWRQPANQRLWVSLAASALAHAIALAVFAGLLLPAPAPVRVRSGEPAVVQVLLAAPQPAAPAPQPETAVQVAPQRPALEPVAKPLPVPKPQEPQPEPPAPVRRIDLRAPAASTAGVATRSDSAPEALAADTPIPPGDVAVGAAETAEPLGHAQALRLAQRFPEPVARPPQLKDPLVVPYPPRAARANREARIAALVIIDTAGQALEATLVPDDPLFGPTVEDALRSAKFRPAEAEAKPVPYWVILEFVFTMRPTLPARLPPTN